MSNRTKIDDFISGFFSADITQAFTDPGAFFSDHPVPPSAILTDGIIFVPMFAVTRLTLNEAFKLPPIGSAGLRAAVGNSDDTVSLNGLLIGDLRFVWKQLLELLSDLSRRGGSIGLLTGGAMNGLILVTRMAVRLDMQVTTLSFTESAQRRDTIEAAISLQHVPRPGPQHLLLDVGMTAVSTSVEYLK